MGTVVISVDAELGWGFQHRQSPSEEQVQRGRWGWERLIELFDDFEIPATWAGVGHLLLEDCNGRHDDHPAGSEWFVRERERWDDRPGVRFGSDLVDVLRSSAVDHDVGYHSFSNIDFGAEETTRELARAELQRCKRLADAHDLPHATFVFPYNSVGHRGLLAAEGFRCYRGGWSPDGGRLRKLAEATVLPGRSRRVEPTVDEYGLVNVPPSLSLFGYEGLARRLTPSVVGDPIVAAARSGIDTMATRDGVFHMWLRQNDVTTQRDVERLESILTYLDGERDEVTVATMADVTAGLTQTRRVAAKP
jgi:peptidoglycan/xylan/chitin deacetylase (PgdA/CDA1 family)